MRSLLHYYIQITMCLKKKYDIYVYFDVFLGKSQFESKIESEFKSKLSNSKFELNFSYLKQFIRTKTTAIYLHPLRL